MSTSTTVSTPPRVRAQRRPLLLLTMLAIVGVAAGQLSLALFTDQQDADSTFGTGSIVLDAARIDGLVLTTSGMMPGASVTDDVVVENDGTAQLRYAMTLSSTNADAKGLRDVLTLTVRTIDVTTPGTPCDNFDGTQLLAATALSNANARIGNPAAGAQAGDRTVNAGASETLCFRVSLPAATGNAYQSATTVTTFTFDAEQTANNP